MLILTISLPRQSRSTLRGSSAARSAFFVHGIPAQLRKVSAQDLSLPTQLGARLRAASTHMAEMPNETSAIQARRLFMWRLSSSWRSQAGDWSGLSSRYGRDA